MSLSIFREHVADFIEIVRRSFRLMKDQRIGTVLGVLIKCTFTGEEIVQAVSCSNHGIQSWKGIFPHKIDGDRTLGSLSRRSPLILFFFLFFHSLGLGS